MVNIGFADAILPSGVESALPTPDGIIGLHRMRHRPPPRLPSRLRTLH